MKFENPIQEGILLKRYKRFLADIKLPNVSNPIVAHVPNSGSMLGVSTPGSRCVVSRSSNPNRKLPYTLEMVGIEDGGWVGVNTSSTNKIVHEAILNGIVKDWCGWDEVKPEYKISKESRLDFMISKGGRKRFIEVKNVSMARPPLAVFPDAVTERGQKHLIDLMNLVQEGHDAEIVFVVQREDCTGFAPCDDIDPEYGRLLRKAKGSGVIVRAFSCLVSDREIRINKPLKINLSPIS